MVELLRIWQEGPYTLGEALARYGEPTVSRALEEGILKVVGTRLGGVLVPAGRGRVLLGKTRYYTPRPSALENALLVRRYVEGMVQEGYRVVRYDRDRAKALLEGNGERVLVLGGVRRGSRPQPKDPLEASASRIVILVPEGQGPVRRGRRVELQEVPLGSR
ncbi:hypothetical protein [Thermus caldifontis]|uniref:hypothetical protein n=1 Tax=Thermus caldifontis TaxID=1930763 RepID=UPI000DF4C280|nr:hypothetical protein [Thermus caldifontis]